MRRLGPPHPLSRVCTGTSCREFWVSDGIPAYSPVLRGTAMPFNFCEPSGRSAHILRAAAWENHPTFLSFAFS